MATGTAGTANSKRKQVPIGKVEGGLVYLPTGYLDADDTLYDMLQLRSMKGWEEDAFMARGVRIPESMTRMLTGSALKFASSTSPGKTIEDKSRFNDIVVDLPVPDRLTATYALRILSLGPTCEFQVTCPFCVPKYQFPATLDLTTQMVTHKTNKKKREADLVLPSGRKLTLQLLTGRAEAKLDASLRDADKLTAVLHARIKALDGSLPSFDQIKDMEMKDRMYARQAYQVFEGGVEESAEVACPSCRRDCTVSIDVGQPDFFFPNLLPAGLDLD